MNKRDSKNVDETGDKLDWLIARCWFLMAIDSSINSTSFPTPEIPKLGKTRIYEFGKETSSFDKLANVMRKDGFRLPTLGEGLVWARKHPNYRGPIALLGQTHRSLGHHWVCVLRGFKPGRKADRTGSGRRVILRDVIDVWRSGKYRFLAVQGVFSWE